MLVLMFIGRQPSRPVRTSDANDVVPPQAVSLDGAHLIGSSDIGDQNLWIDFLQVHVRSGDGRWRTCRSDGER